MTIIKEKMVIIKKKMVISKIMGTIRIMGAMNKNMKTIKMKARMVEKTKK
jgi:hypothetical protein